MGYGVLPVDVRAMRDIVGAWDEWGLEQTPLDEVHDLLALPPDFRVRHVAVDYARAVYLVMLEAPQLPDVRPGLVSAREPTASVARRTGRNDSDWLSRSGRY